MREHELNDWRGALTTARLAPNTGMVPLKSSTLLAADARMEELRDAVRSARADEAHCWAGRVDALTAQLRELDARYMALLKAVAEGVAMQPKTVVLDLGPNVRAKLPAEAGAVRLVRDDAPSAADQAYSACRSGSA